MKITSVLAKVAVNVTFSDGSVKVLHGQYEDGKSWCIGQGESFETARQVSWYETASGDYPYFDAFVSAVESIPWVSAFDFDDTAATYPKVQKRVTDMAGRIEVTLSFDNNEYAQATVILDGVNSNIYYGGNAGPAIQAASHAPFLAALYAAMKAGIEEVLLV